MEKRNIGIILASPAIILIIFVMVVPLFFAFYSSLYNVDYMQFGKFIGIGNYNSILQDTELLSFLKISLIISLSAVIVSLSLGTILALWVDKKTGVFGYLIQMIGLVPWVISMIVATLLWKWVFSGDFSLLNYILSLFGQGPFIMLGTASRAIIVTIFVMAWRNIGYSMVMILAGLKGISHDLIEAAMVDSANPFQILWYIKLPLIKTPVLISAIVLSMGNFNNVTVPMALTGGGPGGATNVISLELYNIGFTYFQFGKASALAILLFLVNIVIVAFYTKAVKYRI